MCGKIFLGPGSLNHEFLWNFWAKPNKQPQNAITMRRKSLLLNGMPFIGKGHSAKVLSERHPQHIKVIGTGDLIRNKRKKDAAFSELVSEMVRKRQLIPDELVYELMDESLKSITDPKTVVLLDGIRTIPQLEWLTARELIGPGTSMAVLFTADSKVCYQRALHRRDTKPDGEREDDAVLEENFGKGELQFQNIWPGLREYFTTAGVTITTIDANRDLATHVVPEVEGIFIHLFSLPIPKSAQDVESLSYRQPRRRRAFAYA